MRINQVNGISFLFTIGFLLLFSSSFLAYLAWEGPGYQGSAAALEAPVMPPALDSAPVPPPDPPPTPAEPAPAAGVLETPPETPVPIEERPAEPEPVQKAPSSKPVTQSETQDTSKLTKPVAEPMTPPAALKPVQPVEKKSAGKVAKASPRVEERKKVKTSRKTRVKKPVQDEDEDITRVPPEWDWFSKPLRMEMKQGKVQILGESSDANAPIVPVENIRVEGASEPSEVTSKPLPAPKEPSHLAVQPSEPSNAHSSDRDSSDKTPKLAVGEVESSERLVSALARLQARQPRRDREADGKALLLPSRGGDAKHVPASLIRLMNALKALRAESQDVPANGAIQPEVVPLAVESDPEARGTSTNSSETLTLHLN